MITGKLIPQQLAFLYVDSKINSDEAKAQEYLDALVYAARLEEGKAGDLYWKDMAKYYSNISNNNIPLLKQAQDLVREGNRMRASFRYKDSLNNSPYAIFEKILKYPTL